jgi:thiol-disulfide isomerase/thioredoxin
MTNSSLSRILRRRRRRQDNRAFSCPICLLLLLFSAAAILLRIPAGGKKSLCWWGADAKVTVQVNQPKQQQQVKEIPKNPVIDLNARNFASHLGASGGGAVWLVEFYSPRCSHCVEFAPTYKEMAKYYHEEVDFEKQKKLKKMKKKIKVAKVNGEVEQALLSRFAIEAYPTFFVIDGWSVYEYNKSRTKANLMKYVEGEYKTDGTLVPFYSSPMGPMGLVQGTVIATGYGVADLLTWMQTSWGISPVISAMVLFGSFFIGIFVAIVAMAIFLPAAAGERPKRD